MPLPPPPAFSDPMNLAEFSHRLNFGRRQTITLALIGMTLALVWRWHDGAAQQLVTSDDIDFLPTYLVRGKFPDQSHFSPEDLLSPTLVRAAWRRIGLDATEAQLLETRQALAVHAIIPASISAARDHLLAIGQAIDPYFPTEFQVTFTRPRNQWPAISLRSKFVTAWLQECSQIYGHINPAPLRNIVSPFAQITNGDVLDCKEIIGQTALKLKSYARQQAGQPPLSIPSVEVQQIRSEHAATWSELADRLATFSANELPPIEDRIGTAGYSRRPAATLDKFQFELRKLDAQIADGKAKIAVIERLIREISPRGTAAIPSAGSGGQKFEGKSAQQSTVSTLVTDDLKIAEKQIRQEARRAQFEAQRKAVERFAASDPQIRVRTTKASEDALAELRGEFDPLLADFELLHERDLQGWLSNTISFDTPQTRDTFPFSLAISGALGLVAGMMLGAFLSSQGIYLPRGTGQGI